MTQIAQIVEEIKRKKTLLCVGLDTDITKIPQHLLKEKDPVFAFNKKIIEATHSYAIAYKLNIAFYESMGIEGWVSLKKTIDLLNADYPKLFTIADAKRGDIGNTAKMYAQTFFEYLNFDAVTVNPYMGKDSITPFLSYENKITILLALTSNRGAFDFQTQTFKDGNTLYQQVLEKSQYWTSYNNLMYVVGATKSSFLSEIRKLVPNHFLLVPGIGSQGGSITEVCNYGLNQQYGLLINSSRGIIYADSTRDFQETAKKEAHKIQVKTSALI